MWTTNHAAVAAISAGFPGAARGVIAVLLTASLAGCAFYEARMLEGQRAGDEQACTGAGYKPGTNEFAKCLEDHDLMRMRRADEVRELTPAAGADSSLSLPRLPRPD
jgi:hypothetical protein